MFAITGLRRRGLAEHRNAQAQADRLWIAPGFDRQFAQAIRLGLGYGLLPLEQCADMLASGVLVDLTPRLHVDVALYWHAWRIQPPRLERMGAALVQGARAVLLPPPS